jgi:histidinol phosphatase-like PHP family hydrolase
MDETRLKRSGYELDMKRIVRHAINTDAHSLKDFELIRYGVGQARRAGLARNMVVNCMNLDELGEGGTDGTHSACDG